MEHHQIAAEELRGVAVQFIEAIQRAGPPKPHPIVWGSVVAIIGLCLALAGSIAKFAGDQGEMRQRVTQLEAQVPRIADVERRQAANETALGRIEQKIDDLKRDLERR